MSTANFDDIEFANTADCLIHLPENLVMKLDGDDSRTKDRKIYFVTTGRKLVFDQEREARLVQTFTLTSQGEIWDSGKSLSLL